VDVEWESGRGHWQAVAVGEARSPSPLAGHKSREGGYLRAGAYGGRVAGIGVGHLLTSADPGSMP